MANFSLFETFFFITLAITFILILLLVYHFKQRISSIEARGDKMIAALQDITDEINNMKRPPQTLAPYPVNLGNDFLPATMTHDLNEYEELDELDDLEEIQLKKEIEEEDDGDADDEEEDEDEEDEEDDEDDEEEEEEDEEDEEEDEDEDEDDEDDEDADEDEDEGVTKVIKVDNLNNDPVEEESSKDLEKKEEQMEIYRKMTLTELRQHVITKGLTTNASKMKKGDLLALLENHEE